MSKTLETCAHCFQSFIRFVWLGPWVFNPKGFWKSGLGNFSPLFPFPGSLCLVPGNQAEGNRERVGVRGGTKRTGPSVMCGCWACFAHSIRSPRALTTARSLRLAPHLHSLHCSHGIPSPSLPLGIHPTLEAVIFGLSLMKLYFVLLMKSHLQSYPCLRCCGALGWWACVRYAPGHGTSARTLTPPTAPLQPQDVLA